MRHGAPVSHDAIPRSMGQAEDQVRVLALSPGHVQGRRLAERMQALPGRKVRRGSGDDRVRALRQRAFLAKEFRDLPSLCRKHSRSRHRHRHLRHVRPWPLHRGRRRRGLRVLPQGQIQGRPRPRALLDMPDGDDHRFPRGHRVHGLPVRGGELPHGGRARERPMLGVSRGDEVRLRQRGRRHRQMGGGGAARCQSSEAPLPDGHPGLHDIGGEPDACVQMQG
mmetsp:Transcript_80175/g.245092  ORF Transcript_80175/g.245092 Transcript_80175/m.245092 type:complete len:223 (-) Transcript_80175:9-677(-)